MKKYVLICSFILSAFTFAASHNSNQQNQNTMDGMPIMMQSQNTNCPTCNNMMPMSGGMGKKMMKNNMMNMTPEMQKDMIDIQQKELDIKKEMLENKVDWNKVEKLNKEVGEIRAKMQTEMMKNHYDMMKSSTTPEKQ